MVDGNKAGEMWAIALSEEGQYLASTTYDGRINVWDTLAGRQKIREYETKGSFGLCIDLVGFLLHGVIRVVPDKRSEPVGRWQIHGVGA